MKLTAGHHSDRIEIEYFTDPLCCWSYILEPHWRRLIEEYEGRMTWRYNMGGLIPHWNGYQNTVNNIIHPAQMGPLWIEATQTSGMPIDERIWFNDPPKSSYPACIAFKCAELQGREVADAYLQSLRKAVMTDGLNIAKQDVLVRLARQLAVQTENFDAFKFELDLQGNKGIEAFKEDLLQVAKYKVGRFPTLIIRNPGVSTVIITGYRPYEVLLQAVQQVVPKPINLESKLA